MDKITFQIVLSKDEDDAEYDFAKLSQQFRDELLKLKVENVDYQFKDGDIKGAKTGNVISWETLLITLATSGGVISTFVNFLLGWIKRNEGRSVTLELNGNKLEVTGLSQSEQKELIEVWLKRNGGILLK